VLIQAVCCGAPHNSTLGTMTIAQRAALTALILVLGDAYATAAD
jgi:hypothetical protein